jgi:hypothetical protein
VVMHTKEGGQVWALWRSKNRCREALASFFVSSLGAPGNMCGGRFSSFLRLALDAAGPASFYSSLFFSFLLLARCRLQRAMDV